MSDITKPLITTIIPTYRRPKLLRRAIKSVLNQTYPHFQVCVYDNASGDEIASVVAELAKDDPRVKYHCHPENIGAAKNIIYGMEHVETPFFSILSDDDILLPEFYQTAMEGFNKFSEAMFSAGSCIHMTDKGEITCVPLLLWQREGYYTPPDGLFEMIGKNYFTHITWTSILFRKEIIEKIGTLDIDVGSPADVDFELRIAARFPFVVSKKPCAIFVIHPSSFSTMYDFQSILPAGWHKIIDNVIEDEWIPLDARIHAESILTKMLERILFNVGLIYLRQRRFDYVYGIAEILKNQYHQKTKSNILYTAAKFFEHFSLFFYLAICLNRVRKILCFKRVMPNKQFQKSFGGYAKFLEFGD